MAVVAILTAAGGGTRLGAADPKALVRLGGQPLVRHAAQRLVASGVVDELVVTAPGGARAAVEGCLAELGLPCTVVDGGPSRQASVAAALDVVPEGTFVLVHDAARPLASPRLVRSVVEALRAGHAAVVPGLPVTDTIKEVEPAEGVLRVRATVDRSALRAIQTPQGFTRALLVRAHAAGAGRAAAEATAASDDAALVEALGESVWVVPGEPQAMKITVPQDLAVAELLLAADADRSHLAVVPGERA